MSINYQKKPVATVIVPAYNASSYLRLILLPLQELGEDWEKIIVDDGSQDDTQEVAREMLPDARILRNELSHGPAAARNLAARYAHSDFLIFLDSDVVVAVETLVALKDFLENQPNVAGVFGCYNQGNKSSSLVADFRNLLHRYVHRQCTGQVDSFWSGLGAMRKSIFLTSGGFRTDLFRHPSIEDVELGKRISEAGHIIRLEPTFEGRHLKCWTLRSMIETDTIHRALPWMHLMLQGNASSNNLNMAPRMLLAPVLLALALVSCLFYPKLAASAMVLYFLANLPIYHFMASRGIKLGCLSVTNLTIHHLCCLVGGALGVCRFFAQDVLAGRGRRPLMALESQEARTGLKTVALEPLVSYAASSGK